MVAVTLLERHACLCGHDPVSGRIDYAFGQKGLTPGPSLHKHAPCRSVFNDATSTIGVVQNF
jgi:hypothetical protein